MCVAFLGQHPSATYEVSSAAQSPCFASYLRAGNAAAHEKYKIVPLNSQMITGWDSTVSSVVYNYNNMIVLKTSYNYNIYIRVKKLNKLGGTIHEWNEESSAANPGERTGR